MFIRWKRTVIAYILNPYLSFCLFVEKDGYISPLKIALGSPTSFFIENPANIKHKHTNHFEV